MQTPDPTAAHKPHINGALTTEEISSFEKEGGIVRSSNGEAISGASIQSEQRDIAMAEAVAGEAFQTPN